MPDIPEYRVRQGGLMRCCLLTLHDQMQVATENPRAGDVLNCKWCPSTMIFFAGAWQWAGRPDVTGADVR